MYNPFSKDGSKLFLKKVCRSGNHLKGQIFEMTNSKQTNVKVTNFEVTVFQNNKFRSIRSYEYSKYSKLLALGQHKRFPKRIFNWSHSLFSFDRCSGSCCCSCCCCYVRCCTTSFFNVFTFNWSHLFPCQHNSWNSRSVATSVNGDAKSC